MFFIYENDRSYCVLGYKPTLQSPYPILIFYNYYVLVALLLYLRIFFLTVRGHIHCRPKGCTLVFAILQEQAL